MGSLKRMTVSRTWLAICLRLIGTTVTAVSTFEMGKIQSKGEGIKHEVVSNEANNSLMGGKHDKG